MPDSIQHAGDIFERQFPENVEYKEDEKVYIYLFKFCLDCHVHSPFLTALSLQASVKKLEQQLADCESALVEEAVVSQERKLQAERAQYQVAHIYCLTTRTPGFRNKWPNVLIRE